MIDLLLSRYGSIELIEWDFVKSFPVIMKAYEKNAEERLFQRWAMNYDRECSFDDFKKALLVASKKFEGVEKNSEEILEDVKGILNSFSKEEAE